MYKSLSQYIQFLEAKGELMRIKEFVDPVLQIGEITDRISKSENGGKALLFENTGTAFPLLINAFGSNKRIAYALGVANIEDIVNRIDSLLQLLNSDKTSLFDKLKLLPLLRQAAKWMPKTIKGKAECQEIVIQNPDLSILPVLKCWPHDGGRFITLPIVHTKDIINNVRNVGMYRMQVFDKNTTAMHWHKHKTGARHYAQYASQGQPMPAAVALGGDPVYTWCAAAPLPDNVDEYLLAGFLRNKQVKMARCITQDIEVPADADIVIEGYIDPAEELAVEGPFGDHTGFYSLCDLYPRFHVTCITHKRNAVYPATIVGIPPQEDAYISKAVERVFLHPLRFAVAPEILDITMPEEGVSHNIAIAKINKLYAGQAFKLAHALWGAGQMMFCKVLIVVDSNVNIRNYNELLNCIRENWRPQPDTHFSYGISDALDHASQIQAYGGKMCIDATKKYYDEKCEQIGTIKPEYLYKFCHKSDTMPDDASVIVIFDNHVDLKDVSTCVWLAGNNIDASRDCCINNNSLIIDACTKHKAYKGYNRPFPNIVCSNDETIEQVDKMWEKLGIGKFIPSPSLTYRNLVQNGGAEILEA
jgi:4-hydroxy-3-polyprenylbenzoate decarboxylase